MNLSSVPHPLDIPATVSSTPGARVFTTLAQNKPEATLVVMGLVTLIIAQGIRDFPPAAQQMVAGILVLGVGMILLGAQAAYAGHLPGWIIRLLQSVGGQLGIHESQVIFLGLACIYAVLAARTIDFGPVLRAPVLTVGLWIFSISLTFLAGWRLEAKRRPTREAWGIALGVTILAFVVRGVLTAQYPPYLTSDEASMGLNAAAFIQGETNNIFNVGWYSFPAFFYYLESFSLWAFGQNIEALRLFSALAGALTVGMVYLLGQAMFGKPAALVAALFLTGLHFHIHFSRLGLNNVWDGLLFTLVLGGLWDGWQHGYRVAFLLAGIALGLAQYLYASTRLLFFLIPAWLVVAGILDRARSRRALPGMFWMGILAFVIAAPLGWFYLNNPGEFWAPLRRVAIDGAWIAGNARRSGDSGWWVVIQHILLGLRAYTTENLSGFYLPKTPLLRPVAGGVFLAGIALLAMRPRDARRWLVFLWILGFGVMTGLTHEPTSAQRFVAAAPAVALVIGFALQEFVHLLSAFVPSARLSLQLVGLCAVLLLAADDIRFYFWEFAPQAAEIVDNNLIANRLAMHLSEQPSETQVYFYTTSRMGFYSHDSLVYLAPQVHGVDVSAPPDQLDPHPTGHVIFVLLPEHTSLLPELQTSFPGGAISEERTREGIFLYTLYEGVW